MSKKLVAYFSASGTTKKAAERLAKATGADLFEIKPKVPYSSADLNWMDKKSRSSVEMSDPTSRPEIAEKIPNLADYDTVFLGFPIWWYVAPRIINTFVESYDFTRKTLVPFATSGGSGMGRTVDELRKLCPNANWKAGKMVNGISDKALADWANTLLGGRPMELQKTDPEFMERLRHFAFDEVVKEENQQLDAPTRYLAILAALIGCGGVDAFREMLPAALENSVTPVMVKETVYQAADYLGYGRMLPFLNVTNKTFTQMEIALPLPGQATTTMNDRLEKGAEAQAKIFGEHMKEAWKKGHINRWLAANCFGDFYTRTGLDLPQREMITFCFLMAQGGCEPQLIAHAKGNMNLGNDKDFLVRVVSQCLPYIGYPRSLNAVSVLDKC